MCKIGKIVFLQQNSIPKLSFLMLPPYTLEGFREVSCKKVPVIPDTIWAILYPPNDLVTQGQSLKRRLWLMKSQSQKLANVYVGKAHRDLYG
jgi:hypothetical protein